MSEQDVYDLIKILGRKTRISTIPEGRGRHAESISVNELFGFLLFLANKPRTDGIAKWVEVYVGLNREPTPVIEEERA